MIERIKHYLHKNVKIHLGPEWNFFGKITLIDEEKDLVFMTTESAEISIRISEVKVITHVPNADRGPSGCKESPYHPTKRTFAYRR